MHGPKSRRKFTDYALGLHEKQKLRYYYGLMERQFRNVYERALKRRGVTGETMLQIARGELAMRYDPVRREVVGDPVTPPVKGARE